MINLYEDIDTNELFTKSELESIIYDNGIKMNIDNFIFENMFQNGGNIKIVNDDIIKWCNDFLTLFEADKYYSKCEQEENLKDMYTSIQCREIKMWENHIIDNIKEMDYIEYKADLCDLLARLYRIV